MNKTICDWTGEDPAYNYKIVRSTDGFTVAQVDLCDNALDDLIDYLRSKRNVEDIKPIMKKEEVVL